MNRRALEQSSPSLSQTAPIGGQTDRKGSGAFWFGLVLGFITYRTLHHLQKTAVSDLAAVVGAIGGAAVLKLLKP